MDLDRYMPLQSHVWYMHMQNLSDNVEEKKDTDQIAWHGRKVVEKGGGGGGQIRKEKMIMTVLFMYMLCREWVDYAVQT